MSASMLSRRAFSRQCSCPIVSSGQYLAPKKVGKPSRVAEHAPADHQQPPSAPSTSARSQRRGPIPPPVLTSLICKADSWQVVASLANTHRPHLNHIHICALLDQAATHRPGGPYPAEFSNLLSGLTDLVLTQLPAFTARAVANSLHSLAVLAYQDDPILLSRLADTAFTHLNTQSFNPQELSITAWSLCRLDITPSQEWLDSFMSASFACLHRFKPQELSLALWCLATWGCRPSDPWIQAFSRAVLSLLPSFKPQDYSNTLWSFGTLGIHPDPEWLVEFLAPSEALLPTFSSQELTNTLWALATLDQRPSYSWIGSFIAASKQQLETRYSSADLAMTQWAMTQLAIRPGATWQAAFDAAARASVASALPKDLANLSWLFVRQGVEPGESWVQQLCAAIVVKQEQLAAKDLATLLYCLSSWNQAPGEECAAALLSATSRLLPAMQPGPLSEVVHGIASLRLPTDEALRKAMAESVGRELKGMTANQQCLAVWALANMKAQLSNTWVQRYLRLSRPHLRSAGRRQLVAALFAVAEFAEPGKKLSKEWTAEMYAACIQHCSCETTAPVPVVALASADATAASTLELPTTSMEQHGRRLSGEEPAADSDSSTSGSSTDSEHSTLSMTAIGSSSAFASGSGSGFTLFEVSSILTSIYRMQLKPPEGWLQQLLAVVQHQLAGSQPQVLKSVVAMLVNLGFHPGKEWLKSFSAAVYQGVNGGWLAEDTAEVVMEVSRLDEEVAVVLYHALKPHLQPDAKPLESQPEPEVQLEPEAQPTASS